MPSSASGKTHANTIQLIAMELTIAFPAVCFGRSGHCLELGRIHLALNAVGRLHVSRRDNREAKHTSPRCGLRLIRSSHYCPPFAGMVTIVPFASDSGGAPPFGFLLPFSRSLKGSDPPSNAPLVADPLFAEILLQLPFLSPDEEIDQRDVNSGDNKRTR